MMDADKAVRWGWGSDRTSFRFYFGDTVVIVGRNGKGAYIWKMYVGGKLVDSGKTWTLEDVKAAVDSVWNFEK